MWMYRRMRGMENRWSREKWRARQDSNPQPLGPKPSALSIELQALAMRVTPFRRRPEHCLGRATGFEPVISCATDRRLDHSATLATHFNAIKYPLPLQACHSRFASRSPDEATRGGEPRVRGLSIPSAVIPVPRENGEGKRWRHHALKPREIGA